MPRGWCRGRSFAVGAGVVVSWVCRFHAAGGARWYQTWKSTNMRARHRTRPTNLRPRHHTVTIRTKLTNLRPRHRTTRHRTTAASDKGPRKRSTFRARRPGHGARERPRHPRNPCWYPERPTLATPGNDRACLQSRRLQRAAFRRCNHSHRRCRIRGRSVRNGEGRCGADRESDSRCSGRKVAHPRRHRREAASPPRAGTGL